MVDQYCLYLRKSRKDVEAEKKGEGATLERHERALLELAKRQKLNVTHVFREIVSGETLKARPQMKELLSQVEKGIWKGVLVVEVERLTRGALSDQDIISKTFTYSKTLIVTPFKTYDLTNRNDAEYLKFGLFMSNQEYTTINRRQQDGRNLSVIEGKYPGNKAPYGYRRKKLESSKGWTLEEYKEEADVVRMIFDLYVNGELQEDGKYKHLGVSLIVRRLNQLHMKPQKSSVWVVSSVRDMLTNPVYAGKLRWNWRATKKNMVGGNEIKSRPRAKNEDYILVDGLHTGIIDEDTFNKAQDIMKNHPSLPVGERNMIKNPLAGLVVCGKCGRNMVRRPYSSKSKADTLMCAIPECDNVSVHLHYVEKAILMWLEDWLKEYKLEYKQESKPKKNTGFEVKQKAFDKITEEIKTIKVQQGRLHDLLEQGVYDNDTFLTRTRELGERMAKAVEAFTILEADIKREETCETGRTDIIPDVQNILEAYHKLKTPTAKNDLLKEILEKVIYTKEKSGRWHNEPDDFVIEVYPKLPTVCKL